MEISRKPRLDLAQKYLPKPLLTALLHIFDQKIEGCMLVGGTALAGFYAGHRRSDDFDLFTRDEICQKATVLAVKSLNKIGVKFLDSTIETAQYFRATCELNKHRFTVDVVLDPNLFKVGKSVDIEQNLKVADLETLLMTKAATLVSRCSEKDLYDLIWLFHEIPKLDLDKLIESGSRIDAGFNAENILISLIGATLSEASCDFSLDSKVSSKSIYKEILEFRKKLVKAFKDHLDQTPKPQLSELVKRVSRIKAPK